MLAEQITHHRGSDTSGVARGLLPGHVLDGSVGVVDDDGTSFTVELKEAFSGTLGLVERTDGKKLDGKSLTRFDGDAYFFIDGGLSEEEPSRHDTI